MCRGAQFYRHAMTDKLIIDCGGSKCAYAINGKTITTPGHNFAKQKDEDFRPPEFEVPVREVHLYGAGITASRREEVNRHLSGIFPEANVEAQSDMLGAARALFGHSQGIACILGTGANTAFYDGEKITAHVPPLGYVLGDEGSGADLGRRFLREYLRGRFSPKTMKKASQLTRVDEETAIANVYRGQNAQAWLASFCPLIIQLCDSCDDVRELAMSAFLDFFINNVSAYPSEAKVGVVGGVAWHFREILCQAARKAGREVGEILKEPLPRLVQYHSC